jgi:hypothetical protein
VELAGGIVSLSTVGSGKMYATLQAWADVVSANTGTEDAECYSGSDLGGCLIVSRWLPELTTIYAATGNRHNGTDAGTTGVAYTSGSIQLAYAADPGGTVEQSLTIQNLRIHGRVFIAIDSTILTLSVTSNLWVHAGAAPTTASFYTDATDATRVAFLSLAFRNNIILWKTTSGSGPGYLMTTTPVGDGLGTQAFVQNNTMIRSAGTMTRGINVDGNGGDFGIEVKNNIVLGASTACYFVNNADFTGSSYNLSSDATGDDLGATGSLINQTASAVVVNVSTDPTLKDTSPAFNAGTTIADFSTDAVGLHRPQGAAWDMGALELFVAITSRHHRRSLRFWRH